MTGQTQQTITNTDHDIAGIIPAKHPKAPKNIDHKRTIELYKKGLGAPTIAKVQGCTTANITMVLQRYGVAHQDVEEFKDHRADIFAGLQAKLLQSITLDDIKKTPTGSRILAVAQLYDKERLERGLSTQNIDTHATQVNITQLSSELDRIRKRRMALQGGKHNEIK